MTTKLTCPECSKVLRPKSPVAPGKKVRCPGCETVFVASGDEDEAIQEEEARPRKARKPAKAAAKSAPEKKPKKKDEDDDGAYGMVRDPDDDDEDRKPKIDYIGATKVKDLRGPAVAAITDPTNWLMRAGYVGLIGQVVLLVIIAILTLLPVTEDAPKEGGMAKPGKQKVVLRIGPGLSRTSPWAANQGGGGMGAASQELHPEDEPEPPSRMQGYGIDFGIICQRLLAFFLFAFFVALQMAYSGTIITGAIKAQNLQSRTWGFVSAIMALLPINTFCTSLLVQFAIVVVWMMVLDNDPWLGYICWFLSIALYGLSLGSGIWTLITLNKPEVIDGFEYVGE